MVRRSWRRAVNSLEMMVLHIKRGKNEQSAKNQIQAGWNMLPQKVGRQLKMSALHVNKTKTWWMEGDEGIFFHLPPIRFSSPLPPTLVIQLADVSSQKSASVWTRLPWRWGDEQQCVCTPLLPSLPSFLLWLSFAPCLGLPSQSWSPVCWAALRSSLSQSERGEEERNSQMAEYNHRWMCCWWRLNVTVYTSQLPLRSRLNSVKPLCLHAPFLCNLNVLPSNITVLLFDRRCSWCFSFILV